MEAEISGAESPETPLMSFAKLFQRNVALGFVLFQLLCPNVNPPGLLLLINYHLPLLKRSEKLKVKI